MGPSERNMVVRLHALCAENILLRMNIHRTDGTFHEMKSSPTVFISCNKLMIDQQMQ